MIDLIARHIVFAVWALSAPEQRANWRDWDTTQSDYDALAEYLGTDASLLDDKTIGQFDREWRAAVGELGQCLGYATDEIAYYLVAPDFTLVVDACSEVLDALPPTNSAWMEKPWFAVHTGTQSHATMRLEDLIPSAERVLRTLAPRKMPSDPLDPSDEFADEYYVELCDAIDGSLPQDFYYGSTPWDGASTGIWPSLILS